MKVAIVCEAPEKSKAIKTLCGSGIKKNPDGSLTFKREFDTKVDATQWLYDRAYEIAKDDQELKAYNSQIRVYGQLTYDVATAKIKKLKD
jgi:hypothetical protein